MKNICQEVAQTSLDLIQKPAIYVCQVKQSVKTYKVDFKKISITLKKAYFLSILKLKTSEMPQVLCLLCTVLRFWGCSVVSTTMSILISLPNLSLYVCYSCSKTLAYVKKTDFSQDVFNTHGFVCTRLYIKISFTMISLMGHWFGRRQRLIMRQNDAKKQKRS